MAQTLSIILAQYYPDKTQLRHTLDSLLIQDTYDFELIIADDGSPQDYWDDTRAYLAAHGFTNVKLSKNKVNQGTVTNMLHAVELASGQWIAGISPGDYVYDASTVRWVLDMLRRDAPQVAFGKSAYYRQESDGTLVQLPGETPFDRTPYDAAHYDNKAIRRNVLLYDDGISGIETMYERGIFLDALQKMNGRVRFAEDFATRLFAVQGIHIRCYDRILRVRHRCFHQREGPCPDGRRLARHADPDAGTVSPGPHGPPGLGVLPQRPPQVPPGAGIDRPPGGSAELRL